MRPEYVPRARASDVHPNCHERAVGCPHVGPLSRKPMFLTWSGVDLLGPFPKMRPPMHVAAARRKSQHKSPSPGWPTGNCLPTAPRLKGVIGEGASGRPEPIRVGTPPLGAWRISSRRADLWSPDRLPTGVPPGRGRQACRVMRAGVTSCSAPLGQPASSSASRRSTDGARFRAARPHPLQQFSEPGMY